MSDPAVPPNDTPTPPEEVTTGVPPAAPAADETAATPEAAPLPEAPAATEATDMPATDADAMPADAATVATTDATPVAAPAAPAAAGMSPAACGAKLAELFPALFGTEGPPKPIKLRIHVDLQARAPGVFSRRVLGPFFARYTTSNAYLKALSTATQRFDLDGQPAGDVTEEHRAAAVTELARRREIAIAKRAAERGAQRPQYAPRTDAPAAGPDGESRRPPRPPRRDGPRPEGRQETGPGAARADRRPDRGPRPPRDDRPARGAAPGARRNDARPAPPPRGDRPDRRGEQRAAQRHDRPDRPDRSERAAEAPEPQDPAQRERALLLRQFESSPLTKANFCVLKRIGEADLDAQLDLARRERAERHKR